MDAADNPPSGRAPRSGGQANTARTGKATDPYVIVAALAPPAPPCFDDRTIWREYLASAIDVQLARHGTARGPLALTSEGRLRLDRLDPSWSFCDDCNFSSPELAHMTHVGTCRRDWWRVHVAPLAEGEEVPRTARHAQGGSRQRRVVPILPVET